MDSSSNKVTASRIAIVGMACRFPGASDLQTFWDNLINGRCSSTECLPGSSEGRVGSLYKDTSSIPSACRHGAFLSDIDQFDAEFFRISPSEAEFLDPQQRMMLETSWRALENANIDPETLRGTSASVFAGMSNNDYRYLILDGADTSQPSSSLYTITGTSLNTAIGRVSFALGFEGPAMTLDTACSSSLVAMHQAVTALRVGETDLSLVGGVQLVLAGVLTKMRANAGMLSPDGVCKTFDERANGYVRGEGCGMVVLKRLEDAQRDGDHIWAEVVATAINQDGTSEGLTVPRGSAQRAVIQAALSQTSLQPNEIGYLEAHGTGTPVGDPIEINAAAEIYGKDRSSQDPLLIGSVKTNIGHLEPAAGVAGVIKTALSIKFGSLPKHLNFEVPNPAIAWSDLPVSVVDQTIPWPVTQIERRIAGINSFGFSGTNAHVILKGVSDFNGEMEVPSTPIEIAGPKCVIDRVTLDNTSQELPNEITKRTKRLLPISGKSPQALKDTISNYADWFEQRKRRRENGLTDSVVADFCWTSSTGRSHFNYRHCVVIENGTDPIELLRSVNSLDQQRASNRPQRIAFAYTGQGSQWSGMGKALYDSEVIFRETIDRCEQVIQSERNESLKERLFGNCRSATDLENPMWVQPCIYAIECALTDLWSSLGVEPYTVIGHSLGEIAAARTAGVLSLEDGCRFAAARGQIMSQVAGPGGMAAVFLPEEEVREQLLQYNNKSKSVGVCIAAFNGSHQVLSGYLQELEPLLIEFENQQVRVQRLKKSPAYHSALVDPILDELTEFIDLLEVSKPTRRLISNVTGQVLDSESVLDGQYWRKHARGGVRFREGVETLAELDVDVILEVGPHRVLGPIAQMCWPESSRSNPVVLASMQMPRHDRPEIPSDGGFLNTVAEAYQHGLDLSFEALYYGEERSRITIPGYVFQYRSHWVPTSFRFRSSTELDHPLLGSRHDSPRGDVFYETELSLTYPSWLQQHRVFGHCLLPGAFFGTMGYECLKSLDVIGRFNEFQLHEPMVFRSTSDVTEQSRMVQLVLHSPTETGIRKIEIFSKLGKDTSWILHATGELTEESTSVNTLETINLRELVANFEMQDISAYYQRKSVDHIELGNAFQNLQNLWVNQGEAVAEISIQSQHELAQIDFQPLMLDACFQVLSAARESAEIAPGSTYLPFGWESLSATTSFPSTIFCYARIHDISGAGGQSIEQVPEALSGDLRFYDRTGRPIGWINSVTMKRATSTAFLQFTDDPSSLVYDQVWRKNEHPATIRREYPLTDLTVIQSHIQSFFTYLENQGVQPESRYSLLLDLETLAHSWVVKAFDNHGLKRVKGQFIQRETLMATMGFAEVHTNLVARILRMLVDCGILSKGENGQFKVVVDQDMELPSSIQEPTELFTELKKKHSHGMYELTLLNRFGSNLIELLTGQADPLALLFEKDDSGAADFYRTAPVSAAGNRLLGDVLARLINDLPKQRPLRVIEVGAGTGATTEIVFAELDSTQVQYTYTDISAGFFGEAERTFADNGFDIEYRVLDIEQDPQDQGFDADFYDIVIAANVLHATRDLFETLSHCHRLLAAGGVIVALESLRGRTWQDLTFGFLDGWWRFNDAYRADHAIASPEIWNRALGDAGFTDSYVFGSETLSEDSGPLGSGTIVATKSSARSIDAGTWIIEVDQGGIANDIKEEFESLGQDVLLTSFDKENFQHTSTVTEDLIPHHELGNVISILPSERPLKGVIHLAALNGKGVKTPVEELMSDVKFGTMSAVSLAQQLMEVGIRPTNGTWFVTQGAQFIECEQEGKISGATLWGLGKVLNLEASYLTPRLVDLDPTLDSLPNLIDELLTPDDEALIAYRNSSRFVARLVKLGEGINRIELPNDSKWIIGAQQNGSLESVQATSLNKRPLEPKEVRVSVAATGLNFSDVLVALGAQDPNAELGLEFAGYLVELGSEVDDFSVGERVIGMGFGTFGPEITTKADLVARTPSSLTLNQAATIPIVFSTAGIAFELARLQADDKVLIHAAAGGVGLAAVQLVLAAGGEVYATASLSKHAYLKSLGITNLYDSRTVDFGKEILESTQGEGVDVVLNSLTSEGFIEASLACLKQNGRFIEIGRLNIFTDEEMKTQRPDVEYHVLSLDELKRSASERVGQSFRAIAERFDRVELQPLRHSKWPMSEVSHALQYLGSARHIGKLVLTTPSLVENHLRNDQTYLIIGGFGGIGCVIAQQLVDFGAQHVVLNGRRDPDPSALEVIESLTSRGIEVRTVIADMTKPHEIDRMLLEIQESMPPLGGIIYSAGVLADASIPNQNWDQFEQVLWPKIVGAWHLHQTTINLDLEFFVLFSSVSGVLGNAGQANHAAANAFLDQLAAYRRSIGLNSQSIAWGAWSDIGEAAEHRDRIESQLETGGTGWISPELGVNTFNYLLQQDLTTPLAVSIDWKQVEQSLPTPATFLDEILSTSDDIDSAESSMLGLTVDQLRNSEIQDRIDLLNQYIQHQLQSILRLDSLPSRSTGFFDLGMDSLMAVELRNRLLQLMENEGSIAQTAIFDYPNVDDLANHILETLNLEGDDDSEPAVAQIPLELNANEKVAVIGLACRVPKANDYRSFWKNIDAGVDAISDGRDGSALWQGAVGDASSDTSYLRRGGFINALEEFDASFFRIRPIEANYMDPRQRILLETCWEAIEDAGINPQTLRGQRVGVYLGLGGSEYRDLIQNTGGGENYLGTSSGITAGRVAYFFGFTGPAMSFDSACASSLVAVHEGIKALRFGEVEYAIVGGANAILSQAIMTFHKELGLLSNTGKCMPFDDDADGYVRSEGCGILLLRRADDARISGDPIWASLLGSSVNQNGATSGLSVPSGKAQEELLLAAISDAGISPSQLDYLETHTTGMNLTDQIELAAIAKVYTDTRSSSDPLILGSIKNQIGHLEWAAGSAGLIKLILTMVQHQIPGSSYINQLNHEIEWEDFKLEVNRRHIDWPNRNSEPLGAISASGLSGTNAHVIVQASSDSTADDVPSITSTPIAHGTASPVAFEQPQIQIDLDCTTLKGESVLRSTRLLFLSGRTRNSLAELVKKYLAWIPDVFPKTLSSVEMATWLADVAWTAGVGRSHFEYRCVVPFTDLTTLISGLQSTEISNLSSRSEVKNLPNIGFAFAGDFRSWMEQGKQWYQQEPWVRTILEYGNRVLEQNGVHGFLDHLLNDNSKAEDCDGSLWKRSYVFSIQVAIASFYQSLGIRPKYLFTTSEGLLAAACVAKAFSFEYGITLANSLADSDAPETPSTQNFSVDSDQLAPPSIPLIDYQSGIVATESDLRDRIQATDVQQNLERHAEFDKTSNNELDYMFEITPDSPTLYQNSGLKQKFEHRFILIPACHPERESFNRKTDVSRIYDGVKVAYETGFDVKFQSLFAGESRRRVTMPTYPFDRKRFWFKD